MSDATVRISWGAVAASDISRYDVYRADVLNGPYWFVAQITAEKSDANWTQSLAQYFYVDPTGTVTNYYTITAYSSTGNILAKSDPFQPSLIKATALTGRTRVDHDYLGVDSLRYLAPGGTPIAQAEIRIYQEPDYLQGRRDTPYAILMTNDEGRWQTSVYLPVGMNYVVQFFKPSGYGPNTVTITV